MNMARLAVAEAKEEDVGKGIARICKAVMKDTGIVEGDVIEITGKRKTVAVAQSADSKDQPVGTIRIEGFIRKNAEVAINEAVLVGKTRVEDARTVVLAPIDMELNVDEDFSAFVKKRLMERAFVEGDAVFVMMLSHAIPFDVFKTLPREIPLQMTEKTLLHILNEPLTSERTVRMPLDLKYLFRIAWLNNLVSVMKAERVVFSIKNFEFSSENEKEVVEAATKFAEDHFLTVHIRVRFESNGKTIGELPWAYVDPLGRIYSTYPDAPLPPLIPQIAKQGAHETTTPPMKRCFKTGVAHCPKDIKFSPRSVVIAMPFGDEFKDTYTYAIRPALEESGLKPWKADEQISNIDIMCKICQAIQESGYVLANITTWNANVVFELGLAYGLGRSAILIKHKKAEVPVDLKGIEYIEYGTIDELKRNLVLFLKQVIEQK